MGDDATGGAVPGGVTTATRPGARARRTSATRERILDAAERLFAEHGVSSVSNRQVAEAAGQGNTAVVGYHFGTKADLVRAIIRRRSAQVERIRERMVAAVEGSRDVRDWVSCLVRPDTEHLALLGAPSWYARFGAQVMTDPGLREIMIDESLGSPALRRAVDSLDSCLALPVEVRIERGVICRHLIVQMFAEHERALADGATAHRDTWRSAGTRLVDALIGVWSAPVTDEDVPPAR